MEKNMKIILTITDFFDHCRKKFFYKMTDSNKTIVIDNGSGLIKAGYSGDEAPCAVFPTLYGLPRFVSREAKDYYVGDEASLKRGILVIKFPIKHGIITDWEMMENIWHHTFYNELKVDPNEHPVLLTETSNNPKENRERMIELMFETFIVPSFSVCVDAVLPLFLNGRTTGLSFDCGYDLTQIVPIVDNHVIHDSIVRLNIGGEDITTVLQNLLNSRGYSFKTTGEKKIVRDIKEKLCYVASNYDAEIKKSKNTPEFVTKYKIPDGDEFLISDELFKCTETLFNPHLYNFDFDGIHKNIFESIKKCDVTAQNNLFSNIILSGGSSLFKGLPERISNEVKNLVLDSNEVNVSISDDPKYGAWIGGSIFSSLPHFKDYTISREEYNDVGPGIVHRK